MKIRIRRLAIPILFCLAVACLIEIPLSETTIFGDAVILWDTLFRAILAVPILLFLPGGSGLPWSGTLGI